MKTMRLLSILMLWVAVALEQPARAAATNKASELPRQNAFSNTNFNFLGQSNASGAAPLSVQMTPEAALGVLKRNAEWPGTSIATNGSAPSVTVTFGTNSWVLPWSGPLVSGFLHSNDWAAFNAKAGTNAPIFTGQVKILGNDLLLDGNLWLTNDIYSEGTIIAQGSIQASNYVRVGTGFQLGNVYLLHGNGTPEGSVSALPQSLYLQTNQTAGIGLWLKTNGTSNTGWWLLAPGSSGGGSSNMQAAAIGYLTMTNLVFNSVTNLGTNAVQVWDASTKRFARSGVYGNTTIVFTNMSTVTNLVGGQFAVDYSAEVFVQQNGQSVTLATLHPVTSESFTFTGGTTNYLTIRWNGTNWSARTSHSPTTGSGSFVLSNAPSIYAPTLLGQTALGTDGSIRFDEHSSAPSTPSSGSVALYAKADGLLYSKDDAGTETLVSSGTESRQIYQGWTLNEDWIAASAVGNVGWQTSDSGGAASVAEATIGGRRNLLFLRSGGTTGNRSGVRLGQASVLPGIGTITILASTYILDTLPDGTEEHTVRVGLLDSVTAAATDGVYAELNRTNAAWHLVTANNSTRSYSVGISNAIVNTWQCLRIVIDASASEAVLSVGTTFDNLYPVATNTANIPSSAGRETAPAISNVKGAGAGTIQGTNYVDYFSISQTFTGNR